MGSLAGLCHGGCHLCTRFGLSKNQEKGFSHSRWAVLLSYNPDHHVIFGGWFTTFWCGLGHGRIMSRASGRLLRIPSSKSRNFYGRDALWLFYGQYHPLRLFFSISQQGSFWYIDQSGLIKSCNNGVYLRRLIAWQREYLWPAAILWILEGTQAPRKDFTARLGYRNGMLELSR